MIFKKKDSDIDWDDVVFAAEFQAEWKYEQLTTYFVNSEARKCIFALSSNIYKTNELEIILAQSIPMINVDDE